MSSKKKALRGILAGSLVLSGCGIVDGPIKAVATQGYIYDFSYAQEGLLQDSLPSGEGGFNEFSGLGAEAISLLKRQYGIRILSPQSIIEEGRSVSNLPWNNDELGALWGSFSFLPPYYLRDDMKPRQIIPNKILPEFTSLEHHGGYGLGAIGLTITTGLDIYAKPATFGDTFDDGAEIIRFLLLHEWTHSFTEKHPEVLDSWAEATGWKKNQHGDWVNDRPLEISRIGGGERHPVEDMANSVAWMIVNPKLLTQERIEFFLRSPFFADWQAVLDYRKTH